MLESDSTEEVENKDPLFSCGGLNSLQLPYKKVLIVNNPQISSELPFQCNMYSKR